MSIEIQSDIRVVVSIGITFFIKFYSLDKYNLIQINYFTNIKTSEQHFQ